MKRINWAVIILIILTSCGLDKEYTPENTLPLSIDFSRYHERLFRDSWSEDYNNLGRSQGKSYRFFVVGTAKNPGRVVVCRNDGFLFSAVNPKGLPVALGKYVRLVMKRYYSGNNWETSYLEIDSLE